MGPEKKDGDSLFAGGPSFSQGEEDSLFSIFEEEASPPAPPKEPLPPERPPGRETRNLEDRLAGIERRLEEAAREKPQPRPGDRDILDYLKQKINELEEKLRESQEKGLSFAYEVKGREEARKESRREMEEFLAAVKRQQAGSETERARGLELEKARARIEVLELKIMEFSAPRPEPPPPAGEMEKLRAGLKRELAADFELLGAKLADKILKETVEPLTRRLDAESQARENDRRDLLLPGDKPAAKAASVESASLIKLAELEAALADGFGKITAAVERSGSGLQAGGAQAADAEARRPAEASGSYDLGFITAYFDNMEKAFCAAAETLARASADARRAAGSPGAEAALIARRHAAILDSAARDLFSALEVFKGIRQEALRPIKKIFGA